MTPRQILEKAASIIENQEETYACLVIKELSGYYGSSRSNYLAAGKEALDMFTIMFEPLSKQPDGGWWTDDAEGRFKRVQALRHTAAMFD